MASVEPVGSVSDVGNGEMKVVTVQGRDVLLVNLQGKLYALAAECTHASGRLDEGRLSGGDVICPEHGGRFDVRNGKPVSGPPIQTLARYGVIVRGNDVLVDVGTTPA